MVVPERRALCLTSQGPCRPPDVGTVAGRRLPRFQNIFPAGVLCVLCRRHHTRVLERQRRTESHGPRGRGLCNRKGGGPCPPLQGLTGAALRAEPCPWPRMWAGRGEAWSPRSSTWGFHGVWVSPLLSLEELGGVLGGEFWHLGQLCLPVCGEAFHYFSSWYSLWGLTCTPTVTPRTQNEAQKGGYGFGRGREIEGSDKDHLEGSYEAQGTEGRGTG